MPRIILACTHQIFISQQRRLKVILFPSQTMESSSLGDRSSSLESCSCSLKALGIKADTTKDTAENCHWFSVLFSALGETQSQESPGVGLGTGRTFCSQDLQSKAITDTAQTQSPHQEVGQHKFLMILGQADVQRAVEWRS